MRVTAGVKFCEIAGAGVGAGAMFFCGCGCGSNINYLAGVGAGADTIPWVRGGCEQVKVHPRNALVLTHRGES